MSKNIAASEFQAKYFRIINEMGEDGELVTITNRGRPVAVLSPVRPEGEDRSIS
ncbi:MAG: type II toxin-antitoxin system prevent-host-death family antitoxin [Rhodospirillales bacterium]|nr:type II toxin-antitoxin system prevent-host-death family antitoxin [Rhodospirillales bacterium]